MNILFHLVQYFNFIPLFKKNYDAYIFFIILLIGLNYFTLLLLGIMLYKVNEIGPKKKLLVPIKILRVLLPLISYFFFGQFFAFFISLFYCKKDESFESPYLQCLTGLWIYSLAPTAIIAMIFQIIIGFITNTLYYKPIFNNSDSDILKKTDTLPEIIYMFTKIIVFLLFISDKGLEGEHWAMLSFLILVTGTNAYFTISYQHRQNKIIMLTCNILSMCPFLGFVSLFIGKIIKSYIEFNGVLYLIILCFIIIFIYFLFLKKNDLNLLKINYKNINDPEQYLNYIIKYYSLIKNNDEKRNSLAILKSVIMAIEENCYNLNCPLSKYLNNLSNGKESKFLLLQSCEKLFQFGISKFKNNVSLKYNYSIFLVVEMNDKIKASIIFNSIKDKIISFQKNYNIYRCKNLIEEQMIKKGSKNYFINKYRNDISQFKNILLKITLMQNQFLSLILLSKIKRNNNFKKLNNIGQNIIYFKKEIEEIYKEVITSKINNLEIINLYSEYIEKIIDDEDAYIKCQETKNIIYSNDIKIDENVFSDYNINISQESNNCDYLIASAELNDLGNIKECTMNICNIFGYQKKELIGNNINILLPGIVRQKHNLILHEQTQKFCDNFSKDKVFSPDIPKKQIYGLSKSKYLIPIKINPFFIKTEKNELIYIITINKEKISLINKNSNDECCILTDDNFFIQSFTPNCSNYLRLNHKNINSNYDILLNIKEFCDEYSIDINTYNLFKSSNIHTEKNLKNSLKNSSFMSQKKLEKNKISQTIMKSIKKDILNKNFSKKCKITWIFNKNIALNQSKNKKSLFLRRDSVFSNQEEVANDFNNENEEEFIMEIKNILLNNKILGYYFCFSKLNNENYKKYGIKLLSDKKKNDEHSGYHLSNIEQKAMINQTGIINPQNFLFDIERSNYIDKSDIKYSTIKNNNKKKNKEEESPENFIPNCSCNFLFDLENLSYYHSNDINKGKTLIENLKKEAIIKIKKYQSQAISLENKIKNTISKISNSSEEEEEDEENSSDYSDDSLSIKEKDNSLNNKEDDKKEKISPKDDKIENHDDDFDSLKKMSNRSASKNNRILNILNNGYYKVNLNNIHFMVFDFYKGILIEDTNKNISKIDEILRDDQKDIITIISKDINYPTISFPKSHEEKQKKKSIQNIENKIEIKPNDTKILDKRIFKMINNQKEESHIKLLKLLNFICFIIMLILFGSCYYYFLSSYSKLKQLIKLVKNIVEIKYCNRMSVFYVGDSTLLNYKMNKIVGGTFHNYPSNQNDKEGYIAFMRQKIKDLFISNQLALQFLLSDKLELSKNSSQYLSKIILYTDYIMNDGHTEMISGDIFTTLMQYNSAFYNLATSPLYLEQNHTDILNFLHNSFNDYAKGINLLIQIYYNEIIFQAKNMKIIWIVGLVVFFLIYLFIYFIILKGFINSNKVSLNYLEVFYGIDEQILRKLISKCEILFKKLNCFDLNNEEEKSTEGYENKVKYSDNKTDNNKKANIFVDKKVKIELNDKVINIIIFFAIFQIITFNFFIFNCIFFIKIINKTISISQYLYKTQDFHSYLIDIFIIYRQYVFDDSVIMYNNLPFDYLKIIQENSYESLFEDYKFINTFIKEFLSDDEEVQNNLKKSYCLYNTTYKFNSTKECEDKYGQILKYNFNIMATYFIEEIRINRNLVKYLLSKNILRGSLNDYNEEIWLKDETIPKVGENYTGENIFRLDLFNNETIYAYLDLIFVNIILPYIEINRQIIIPHLSIDNKELFLNVTSVFYLIFIFLIYLVYLLLLIKSINIHIYKTKNMLTLIPLHILSSQNNIKELLHLSKND